MLAQPVVVTGLAVVAVHVSPAGRIVEGKERKLLLGHPLEYQAPVRSASTNLLVSFRSFTVGLFCRFWACETWNCRSGPRHFCQPGHTANGFRVVGQPGRHRHLVDAALAVGGLLDRDLLSLLRGAMVLAADIVKGVVLPVVHGKHLLQLRLQGLPEPVLRKQKKVVDVDVGKEQPANLVALASYHHEHARGLLALPGPPALYLLREEHRFEALLLHNCLPRQDRVHHVCSLWHPNK